MMGGAFVLTFLLITIPSVITPRDVVMPGSDAGSAALGFIQLVALVIPALAIFAQAMFSFSYRRSEEPGKSGGIGPFGPEEFRAGVWLTTGISSFFLTIGLVSLFRAVQLPSPVETGMLLILLGVAFVPGTVLGVGLLAFPDT